MDITALTSRRVMRLGDMIAPTPKAEAVAFPFGLGEAGVHELVEDSYGDMAALTGMALAAGRRTGAALWVTQYKHMRTHGRLFASGAAPARRLVVRANKPMEALWAVDEAVRSNAVSLVVAEVEEADFTATRRLKLVCERHGVPVILLMPYSREGTTACETRWRVSAAPSGPNLYDPSAPGAPRWRAVLERCRPAPHRAGEVFELEYDHETLSLRLASGLAAGASAPDEAGAKNAPIWRRAG